MYPYERISDYDRLREAYDNAKWQWLQEHPNHTAEEYKQAIYDLHDKLEKERKAERVGR